MTYDLLPLLTPLMDVAYRDFQVRLVPELTPEDMLGVRMPALRRLGCALAAGADAQTILHDDGPDRYHEETLLRGIVIGAAKLSLAARLAHMAAFVPRIANWAVCDAFVSGLRFKTDEMGAVRAFLSPYLASPDEFPARFGCVMLLRFFVQEDCLADTLADTLACLTAIPATGYNARMGVAWALAECLVRHPVPTLAHLEACGLDTWTHRKTLQKALESRRLTAELRPRLREMRSAL